MSETATIAASPAEIPDAMTERKRKLNERGFNTLVALSGGLGLMEGSGLVSDTTKPHERARGRVNYETVPRTRDDHVGGWREYRDGMKTKLIRVTVNQPDLSKPDVRDGYVQVELADSRPFGQTKMYENKEVLRVSLGADGVPHVAGERGGAKFSVDHSTPEALPTNLSAAENIMSKAIAGLVTVQPEIPGLPMTQ